MNTGMVVVGSGACGVSAALSLRERGWTGPITMVGAESGEPYERPQLSKNFLRDSTGPAALCTAERLRDHGILLLDATVATELGVIEHEVVLADGRSLPYLRLLLATGARARRLPFGGAGVLALRDKVDAAAIRDRLRPGARVGVIGAGLVGLEVAAAAADRDCTVTVVELAPTVLGRAVPRPIAHRVLTRHALAGVDVRCGTGLRGVETTAAGTVLRLDGGTDLVVDTVVAGIGAVPETGLAERAGLALENGVAVDACFATSAPDVFAAGDCCSVPDSHREGLRYRSESWRAAQEQGAAVAAAMLEHPMPIPRVPWFWSDQYELSLQVAGRTDAASDAVVRVRPDGALLWFGSAADGRVVAAGGIGTGTSAAKDFKRAEMMIAAGTVADRRALADPAVPLRALTQIATSASR